MDERAASNPAEGAKRPSVLWSLLPIVALIALLGAAYALFGEDSAAGANQIALIAASLIAMAVGVFHGFPYKDIGEAAVDSVKTGVGAIFILLAVGALIGTWAMSGTLMAMVYWGLKILSPDYFYFTTVLICAVVALCIGSSWTVAGTIGVGLMGVAQQMDLRPVITAGAIISGAYFGDKSSPLSDTANLAAAAAGSDLYTHVVESLWTSTPALLAALIVFFLLGAPGDFDTTEIMQGIAARFDVSLLPFLPLAVVLALALLKYPAFVTIAMGALAGGIVALFTAPADVIAQAQDPELARGFALLKGVWHVLANGFVADTGSEELNQFLTRGGMSSMLITIWLILTALAFGGIVEKIGVLDCLLEPLLRRARSTGALVTSLVTSAISANILTADQYIAIVLPGRVFKTAFRKAGLAPVVLSRAVGDSATVTSALIPWNSCGAYMAATLGVATTAYAPFAIFNLLNPLISILFAFLGFRMLKADPPAQADPE